MKPKGFSVGRPTDARPQKRFKKPTDRPSRPGPSLPENVFIVEGAAAVKEYLRFKPGDVVSLYVKERQAALLKREFAGFDAKLTMVADSPETREMLPASPVWAHVRHEPTDFIALESLLERNKKPCSLLVLDHISDPRNLGAIARSAAFFGVGHIIVAERRQVLLTPSAVATAQGGFALCNLCVVVNISRTLERLKELGFWILGATMDGESCGSLKGRYDRQAIVLGSEDKGISPNVLAKCDVNVGISGAKNSLDSLNVSVAAGILLHQLIVLP